MLLGTQEQLKELFSSDEKSFRKERILLALSPRFISYLDHIEGICMMKCQEKPLVLKVHIAFAAAYSNYLSVEDLAMYIEHKFLKNGGYFYEMAHWYAFNYYDLSKCDSIIQGDDEFKVIDQCPA